MADVVCACWCHRSIADRGSVGPSVLDPIAAITACSGCQKDHCPAFLSRRLPNDPEPREKAEWVDPPQAKSSTVEPPPEEDGN
jgi:hypothetical protein